MDYYFLIKLAPTIDIPIFFEIGRFATQTIIEMADDRKYRKVDFAKFAIYTSSSMSAWYSPS